MEQRLITFVAEFSESEVLSRGSWLLAHKLKLVIPAEKEVDTFGLVAVVDIIVAVDIVVQLEEHCPVGLLVLTTEVQYHGWLEGLGAKGGQR